MISVHTANVTTALAWGVDYMQQVEQTPANQISPRGARTIESPEPVCTVYWNPTQRVLMNPHRDANPFFHFFEALWMLAGRCDVEFVAKLNKQIASYSDDEDVIHGAYGFRWRSWFGFDQLDFLVDLLREEPSTRRAVLTMWSPNGDTIAAEGGVGGLSSKDVPCNTQVFFKVRRGKLNMTVSNRSNDMLWGAYGANAVHMSMLLEYMAGRIGVEVGIYRQVSDSFHVYLDDKGGALWTKLKEARKDRNSAAFEDPYRQVQPRVARTHAVLDVLPMGAGHADWALDLQTFFDSVDSDRTPGELAFSTPFFRTVVAPMWRTWVHRDRGMLVECHAPDWAAACNEWLERRVK